MGHRVADHGRHVEVVGNGSCHPYSMGHGEGGSGGGSDRDAQASNLEVGVGHDGHSSYPEGDSHHDGKAAESENGSDRCGEYQVVAIPSL